MTYVENIFVCIAVPLAIAVAFTRGGSRRFCVFILAGLVVCLLSAYINSFLVAFTGYSTTRAAVYFTPITEELMKFCPLLFYFLVMEPDDDRIIGAAVGVGVGFATFENCCYLITNVSVTFSEVMIRGLAVGVMHTLCTIITGLMLVWFARYRRMTPVFMLGVFSIAVIIHAVYNLLVSVPGVSRYIGFAMPLMLLAAVAGVEKSGVGILSRGSKN
jgi:RsiW-degrading membrane proteinase PrsW (M82 family)